MGYGFNGGGGAGGFGGMQQIMRQAQKMQEDMAKAKKELEEKEFTSVVGGGMVSIIMNGNKTVKNLTIKPEVVDPEDVEMLEDLIVSALNDSLGQIAAYEKENMPNIPGM